MSQIYLDHSATTPLRSEVAQAMTPYWSDAFGNPSSPHSLGADADQLLRRCRNLALKLLADGQGQMVFTSGGTESNNLALQGSAGMAVQPGHIITSGIEHPSVSHTIDHLQRSGWSVTVLPVDGSGRVKLEDLNEALRPTTRLVSIMWVNNEVGTIQDIRSLGKAISDFGQKNRIHIRFHVDGVQALWRLPIHLQSLPVDMVSFSGHKIGGPKGTGLLWLRHGLTLRPLFFGGGQENGLRSGTENLTGIVGLTKALQMAVKEQPTQTDNWQQLRELLWQQLAAIPLVRRTSPDDGAAHILHVCIPYLPGEVVVQALSERGVHISTGSACSSRAPQSLVLQAMGVDAAAGKGALRFSLGQGIDRVAVQKAGRITVETVTELQAVYGRE